MFTKASLVALACVVLAEATAVPSSVSLAPPTFPLHAVRSDHTSLLQVSSASDVNPVVTSTYTATKLYNTVIPG